MIPGIVEMHALGVDRNIAKRDAELVEQLRVHLQQIFSLYSNAEVAPKPLPGREHEMELAVLERLANHVPAPAGPELLQKLASTARWAQAAGEKAVSVGHKFARGGRKGNAVAYGTEQERRQLSVLVADYYQSKWTDHPEWSWTKLCKEVAPALRRLVAMPSPKLDSGGLLALLIWGLEDTGNKHISYKTVGRFFPNPHKKTRKKDGQ